MKSFPTFTTEMPFTHGLQEENEYDLRTSNPLLR